MCRSVPTFCYRCNSGPVPQLPSRLASTVNPTIFHLFFLTVITNAARNVLTVPAAGDPIWISLYKRPPPPGRRRHPCHLPTISLCDSGHYWRTGARGRRWWGRKRGRPWGRTRLRRTARLPRWIYFPLSCALRPYSSVCFSWHCFSSLYPWNHFIHFFSMIPGERENRGVGIAQKSLRVVELRKAGNKIEKLDGFLRRGSSSPHM
jgi:hypothetical protein